MNMTLNIACSKCGLKARYRQAPHGLSTTEFDSVQFNETCKTPNLAKIFDCPDLAKAILMAGQGDFAPAT